MSDYIWVCAVEKATGRPIVHGPHKDENEGREWGFAHIQDGDFEVLTFPTCDRIKARDHYKSIMLERTNLIASTFPRAKYKV